MITITNLKMMSQRIKELEREGFKCVGSTPSAKYFSKNADHRVVTNTGVVKRGQPNYRKSQ